MGSYGHTIPPTSQATDFLESQAQKSLGIEYSHNSEECIGCASEEGSFF